MDKFQETPASISLDAWILVAKRKKKNPRVITARQGQLCSRCNFLSPCYIDQTGYTESLLRFLILHLFLSEYAGITESFSLLFAAVPRLFPFGLFGQPRGLMFSLFFFFFCLILPSVFLTITVNISIWQTSGLKLYPSLPTHYRPATFSHP